MSTTKKESAKKSTVKKTKEVVEEVIVNNDKLLEPIEEVDTDPVPENLILDGEKDFEEDTPTEEPVDYPEKEDCEGEDMTEKEYEDFITAHKNKEEEVREKTTNKRQRPTKDNIESLLYGYGR
jgi:hypothetical protein